MEAIKLSSSIDNISNHYCEILSRIKNPDDRLKIFQTFYSTLLLIQQLHLEQVCSQVSRKSVLIEVLK
ncbi:hypothetical protein [Persephonella sp.]